MYHMTRDVLEERITSIIKVTRIGELGMLAVTINQSMLNMLQHALVASYC
jgi:hypothetical protein